MSSLTSQAHLILDGNAVGLVTYRGSSDSWSYGDFEPAPEFSRFAPLFGSWSLLIHAEDDETSQSPAASEELREAEVAIDALRAELRWVDKAESTRLSQVNIDGRLIEWKHV
jgi:hypothetical protein